MQLQRLTLIAVRLLERVSCVESQKRRQRLNESVVGNRAVKTRATSSGQAGLKRVSFFDLNIRDKS